MMMPDDELGIEWCIHPFVWHVNASMDSFKTDFEAESYQWVKPFDVGSDDDTRALVPNLAQTIGRVYVPPQIVTLLHDIQADRKHGGAELSIMGLHALRKSAQSIQQQPSEHASLVSQPELAANYLTSVAWHIAHLRPSMAPIANVVMQAIVCADGSRSTEAILNACDTIEKRISTAQSSANKATVKLLTDMSVSSVMVSSYSSSVRDVILEYASARATPGPGPGATAAEHPLEVIVCESRPLNEGHDLANVLAESEINTIHVTLITDAQAAIFMPKVDCVLFGADRLFSHGFVNKSGSLMLALTAKYHMKPVVVVSTLSKCGVAQLQVQKVKENHTPEEEEMPESEVVSADSKLSDRVTIRNVYFEKVDAELVQHFVTEQGVMDQTALAQYASEVEQLYSDAFGIRTEQPTGHAHVVEEIEDSNVSGTKLLYLTDTYQFESSGVIQEIRHTTESDSKDQATLVLDATIFHPQGGGQPSDVGTIFNASGDAVFQVTKTVMDDDIVLHHGQLTDIGQQHLNIGERVSLKINQDKRRLYARIHSAGHLLDIAMEHAGFHMTPTNGYHFPDGPYVEYAGNIAADDRDAFMQKLSDSVDTLLANPLDVAWYTVPYTDIGTECGGFVPPYLPDDKPARIVRMGTEPGCPCGGTHVRNIREIGNIRIVGCKKKKKNFRVKYVVE
jgi:translation initiation factor 2B subunit (eIF-2B alpha/beta/delta family)/Ser-tRNA(Ala) deacylase AlaX